MASENIKCPCCNGELVISSIDGTTTSAFAYCPNCGDIELSDEEILIGMNNYAD